jgi:UDP-2,3-diacylglucosamine pyrophosphatase LpxH
MSPKKDKARYRTVWISDLHLGTKACRVEPLIDFLSSIECEYLFLVGDVIDLWALRRKWYWPQSHNDVIRKILKRSSKGAHVVYIPGNHDENFRGYIGLTFGGVEINSPGQVLNTAGRPIRGLFASGDIMGLFFHNYPSCSGQTRNLVFGMIAGRSAAASIRGL